MKKLKISDYPQKTAYIPEHSWKSLKELSPYGRFYQTISEIIEAYLSGLITVGLEKVQSPEYQFKCADVYQRNFRIDPELWSTFKKYNFIKDLDNNKVMACLFDHYVQTKK